MILIEAIGLCSQTNVLMGIEHETAKRKKPLKPEVNTTEDNIAKTESAVKKAQKLNKHPIKTDEIVPVRSVEMMLVDDGDEQI